MASHNSKYYRKKINKKTVQKCSLLTSLGFNNTDSHPSTSQVEKLNATPEVNEDHVPLSDVDHNNVSSTAESIDVNLVRSEAGCPTEPEAQSPDSDSEPISKRKKMIDTKYELHYDWLYYSSSKNGYLCKICELFAISTSKQSPYMCGTILGEHPVRKLETHQSSALHTDSVQKYLEAKGQSSVVTIPDMFKRQRPKKTPELAKNREYMSRLISTAHLVVQKRWALDSVSAIIDHMADSQCTAITSYLKDGLNFKYTSSKSVTDILSAISCCFEQSILEKVRASTSIALLADESTDEANRSQFAILLRFLDNDTVADHFLGLVNVKKADAATLMEAISVFLISKDIDITKVAFVGFDGCNTMSGEIKGVQRRFRHAVPHSIYINCRSHRLALCVKHLMNNFEVLNDVDEVLLGVYKLFDNSPQKFAIFKDVQSAYEVKELVMVRAAATRWLSHGTACTRLIDRYIQIIDTLDEILDRQRAPEVVGLRDMVTDKTTVAAILVLCDMLQPVNLFCKYLQGTVDFSSVSLKLKELIDTLHHLIERFRTTLQFPDPVLYISKMKGLFADIDERTVFTRRLRARHSQEPQQIIVELAIPMVQKLIDELESGFEMSPVLKAFSVFRVQNLPQNLVELAQYGKRSQPSDH